MYFKYAQPVVKYADCAKGQFTPHESDCTKYYQCLADGYLEVACPNGLHWNQGIMGCDWPANAGCDPSAAQGEYVVRLKAHPSVPNANLSNLKNFSNSDVPGLV